MLNGSGKSGTILKLQALQRELGTCEDFYVGAVTTRTQEQRMMKLGLFEAAPAANASGHVHHHQACFRRGRTVRLEPPVHFEALPNHRLKPAYSYGDTADRAPACRVQGCCQQLLGNSTLMH
jgi:hypothetical protein